MKFHIVQSPQAYSEIIEQVCDAILRGEIQKGDRLPPERQIALDTGISRTSVREAIHHLSQAGLLSVNPGWGGGTFLVSVNMSPAMLGIEIEIELKKLRGFYEARNIIEIAAAQLTAVRATPELILELEQTVLDMQRLIIESPLDYESYFLIDTHFHRLVIKGAGNESLFDLYIPILRKLWFLRDLIHLEDMHAYGIASMRAFVKAVQEKNPQAASEAIQLHVSPLMELIMRGVDAKKVDSESSSPMEHEAVSHPELSSEN